MKMSIRGVFFGIRSVLILCAAFWGAVAIGQQSVARPDYVVSRPVINMYSTASNDAEVASQALYGSGVLSLEKKKGWIRIRTGDDYTGWVAVADITPLQDGYAPNGKAVRVAELSANLYREPSTIKHAPILNLPWEARLELIPGYVDKSGRWLQVKLVNGQTAYIEQGNVSADFAPLTIDQTIQLARRFLGITYTWGGVSSYGFDCSGFTQMLVRQRGIIMPRDAGAQASWGGAAQVERKDLQPGDLLFFGASLAKITHTGMYIGNGEFIHDTSDTHPGVQISKLDDMPWTKLLVAVRRVK
ncbi:MAG TPA: C40 family peptidase [Terracidiphilus sp.]|jgi:SH3-like domain-containing protein